MTAEERIRRDDEYGFFLNDGMDGKAFGFRCDKFGFRHHWFWADVPLYHFQLDAMQPLTYVVGRQAANKAGLPQGTEMQPCKKYDTDYGSVPTWLWWRYSPDRFISWLFHDSCYQFHYIWIRLPTSALWIQHPLTRAQADWLFCYYGIMAEDGSRFDAAVIFNAVNLAGWAVW